MMNTKTILLISSALLLLFSSISHQKAVNMKQYLHKYGYISSTEVDNSIVEEALKEYQKNFNLPTTGELNQDTIQKMSVPRCGMPDRAVAYEELWLKNRLTYNIRNWTEPFSKSIIKNALENAIKLWTKNVDMTVSESQSERADIDIYFTDQDGKSNVLGYAYYPQFGDIYFDRAEDWTLEVREAYRKIYFGWVLAHELGHSLGLKHAPEERSIMYAYYNPVITEPTIMDNNNLKEVYGGKPALHNEELCARKSVDAMLSTESKGQILVKGRQYWTLTESTLQSGPFLLDMLYSALPDNIDAAFSIGKRTYFFKDNVFYKFETGKKEYKRKLISAGFENLPSNLDAAFFEPNNKIIYFFKGAKYYTINLKKSKNQKLIINDGRISDDWRGIPDDVEAATFVGNNNALFIKNFKCYMINLNSKDVSQIENCASTLFRC